MRKIFLGLLALSLMTPAHAAWREATSEKFIVYSNGREADLVRFVKRVELFDQVLRTITAVQTPPSPIKFRIYLVNGPTGVGDTRLQPPSVLEGFYSVRMSGGIAVVDRLRARSKFDLGGETVMYHEYAHHFMSQYASAAYPTWYQEGFAEYVATAKIDEQGEADIGEIAMHRVHDLVLGEWLTTAEVMEGDPSKLDAKGLQIYAQGWLLTHYLFHNATRHPQFIEYLKMSAEGMAHAEALQKSFGLTDDELNKELREYLKKGKLPYTHLSKLALQQSQIAVRQLSKAEDDLLMTDLRLELGVTKDKRDRVLRDAREIAARYPQDAYARRVLAEAEARYGDPELALKILEPLIAQEQPDRRALLVSASIYLRKESTDQATRLALDRKARSAAIKANRQMSEDPAALLLYYTSFRAEDGGPTQNAVDALAKAYENLPQYEETMVLMACEALRHNEFDRAINFLKPIAYTPHGSGYAQMAAGWIDAIRERRIPELPRSVTWDADDP